MFRSIKILRQHGIQYVPDIRTATLTPLFRGRPEISGEPTPEQAIRLLNLCPSGAIKEKPFSIDLGKCVFCRECEFAAPETIRFTNDHHISTNIRENLVIEARQFQPVTVDPDQVRKEIRSIFRRSLKLRQVSAAGDASTEMELNASGNVNFDMGRYGIEFVASPRHADGLVITGPISENMAEALQICYDATPSPKILILCGTDAISGGIFSEIQAVNRKFLDQYPIDLFVPGNPVHPLTFINGVLCLIGSRQIR
jgi:Ni,Fe-hydrogenase III small subunit/NAD-dependent dihydropyrimidine dehydrogenase PreA subunit